MTQMYIVSLDHPTKQIYKAEYSIVSRKYSWAMNSYGRRHLIGASAFFTLVSAERAKLGLLTKITINSWMKNNKPGTVDKAQEQLDNYKIFKLFN